MAKINIYSNTDSLARAAAGCFLEIASRSIADHGLFSVALSGGTTPQKMYRLLGKETYARRVDWFRVHIFFGDERCVPPDHADSNFRIAHQLLIEHVPIPEHHVHRMRGELEPQRAAVEYERELNTFFTTRSTLGLSEPSFDMALMGLGTDGHTASLFPGRDVSRERSKWVVAHYVKEFDAWRITLTPRVINSALNVVFIISGEDKSDPLKKVLEGPRQPEAIPAQSIDPARGELLWLLDAGAASRLEMHGSGKRQTGAQTREEQ